MTDPARSLSRLSDVAPRIAVVQAQTQPCYACKHEAHEPGQCQTTVNGGTGYFGFIPVQCPCVASWEGRL